MSQIDAQSSMFSTESLFNPDFLLSENIPTLSQNLDVDPVLSDADIQGLVDKYPDLDVLLLLEFVGVFTDFSKGDIEYILSENPQFDFESVLLVNKKWQGKLSVQWIKDQASLNYRALLFLEYFVSDVESFDEVFMLYQEVQKLNPLWNYNLNIDFAASKINLDSDLFKRFVSGSLENQEFLDFVRGLNLRDNGAFVYLQHLAITNQDRKQVLFPLLKGEFKSNDVELAVLGTMRGSYKTEGRDLCLEYFSVLYKKKFLQEFPKDGLDLVFDYFENNPENENVIAESELPLSSLSSLALIVQRNMEQDENLDVGNLIEQLLLQRASFRSYEIVNSETDVFFLSGQRQDVSGNYLGSDNMFDQTANVNIAQNSGGNILEDPDDILVGAASQDFTLNRLKQPEAGDSWKVAIFISSHGRGKTINLADGVEVSVEELFYTLKARALWSYNTYGKSEVSLFSDSCLSFDSAEMLFEMWENDVDLVNIVPPVWVTLANDKSLGSSLNTQSIRYFSQIKNTGQPFTGLDFMQNIENYNFSISNGLSVSYKGKKYEENNDAGIFFEGQEVGVDGDLVKGVENSV